jgi:YVTN family beta-propeller protein
VTRGSIVDIIDTTTNTLDIIHGPVTVGQNALFGITYDPIHQTMYVSNSASDDVSVINTDTGMDPNEVIATISDITHASGLAYDPVNDQMYVTEFLAIGVPGSNVRVIDTNTNALVGDPIPVGSLPEGIAYEPEHGRMYVANFGSDSVSVIQTPQSS